MQTRTVRLLLGYTIVALVVFAVLAVLAKTTPYFPGDVEITRALQSFRSPWLDVLMDLGGQSGSPPQTLLLNPLIVLIVFLCRMKRSALTLLIFIPLIGTLGTLVRIAIDRSRPNDALVYLMHPTYDPHYAFPSGHVINFVCVLGFLMYVAHKTLPSSARRTIPLFMYALTMIWIAVSRIYVADHWTSDVLAGALLGNVFLVWMILFYEGLNVRGSPKDQRAHKLT